jgi:cytoskeletal protein RodZ
LPELDPDLVRIIALGLLGVLVLLLVAILASLGRLRKSMDAVAAARQEHSPVAEEPRPEAVGAAPVAEAEPAPMGAAPEPLETTPAEEPAREPEPAAQEPELAVEEPAPTPEPAAQEPAVHEPVAAQPAAEEPVVHEPEPVVGEPAATQEQPAVQEQQPAAAVAVDEPQEQPFERDGRWWFRRGDELLVYNDASGQWEAAPTQSAPAATSAGAVGAEQAAPAQTQEQQGFWKCPSCGAVNGSTATTCRMCFTARP